MTKDQFRNKLKVRLRKRLKTKTFDEMTVGGSKMRFDMALAIDGYPFEIPDGENEKDYEPLLSSEQYQSNEFDQIINEVFSEAMANARENA
jgi:hypothetical protein